MKKLSDMTANELMYCVCKMADPAERIFCDNEVLEAFDAYRGKLDENTKVDKAFSAFSTVVIPKLMGKHANDTYQIIGALRGESAEEVSGGNGAEVMRDIFVAFGIERDVEGLFRPGCEARG